MDLVHNTSPHQGLFVYEVSLQKYRLKKQAYKFVAEYIP